MNGFLRQLQEQTSGQDPCFKLEEFPVHPDEFQLILEPDPVAGSTKVPPNLVESGHDDGFSVLSEANEAAAPNQHHQSKD